MHIPQKNHYNMIIIYHNSTEELPQKKLKQKKLFQILNQLLEDYQYMEYIRNQIVIYTQSNCDLIWHLDLISPPSEVNISISFLKVEGNGNSYLGEKQLSKSIFYDDYILPKMKEFSSNTRDAILLSLLRNSTFVNKLLKHPFLDSYVMTSPSFPEPHFIQILSRIALKRDMDLNDILISAKSITNKLKLNNKNVITKVFC